MAQGLRKGLAVLDSLTSCCLSMAIPQEDKTLDGLALLPSSFGFFGKVRWRVLSPLAG